MVRRDGRDWLPVSLRIGQSVMTHVRVCERERERAPVGVVCGVPTTHPRTHACTVVCLKPFPYLHSLTRQILPPRSEARGHPSPIAGAESSAALLCQLHPAHMYVVLACRPLWVCLPIVPMVAHCRGCTHACGDCVATRV